MKEWFPSIVLSITVNVDPSLKMPPPSKPAVFPETSVRMSVSGPLLLMPPPACSAWLSRTMQSVTVSVPFELLMAPPLLPESSALPCAIVTPVIVTVVFGKITNARSLAEAASMMVVRASLPASVRSPSSM